MDGADENFAKDMNTLIKNVDRLRHATGASVMLIHHTGQKGDRERGSSALKAAADVFIKLSGNVTTTATLRCEKMKTATRFDPISLCFEPTGQSLAVVSRG
jgi:RecA-family ATPase